MGLTVLNVAFVFAPVGPDTAGGAEQVLAALDRALVAAGHRSLVVACAGSKTAGELLATEMLPAQFTEELRRRAQRAHRARIRDALRQWPVDLVHCHGHDFADYLPPPNVRTLVTLHLPVDHYPGEALAEHRPRRYFNCVSASQRRSFPANDAMLPEIPNGVPVAELQSGHAKRKFVLALGRICPEKGFHDALDAAALARTPLLLAGHVFPYPDHLQYFAENIQPRLGPQARFLGNLGLRRKRRFLTAARCLLMPSQIAETSSLGAMEAMACGTPVIAFPVGALPGDRRAWHHRISRRRHQANGRSHSHRREDRSRALPEGGSTAIFARENDCGIFRILSEAGSTMRVEPVTSQAAVDRLVPEWEALWRGVPDATPFQSPAWLASWWSCFGNEAPLVLTARDGQRLIAVLPLYIYDESECRKALPIGIGLSDYLDALVDPGHSGAIGLLLEALAKYRGWGECYIPDLPSGAALLAAQTPANVVAQRRMGGRPAPF
jgi:hypothetical protein